MTMNTITTAYTSGNNFYKSTGIPATSASQTSDQQEKEEPVTSTGGVRVSLSTEVAEARTREFMGLAPTGPLKLGDFETAADTQEEIVQSKLAAAVKKLGIDEKQKMSLTLDSENNIIISESFSGKADLLEELNSDDEFGLAFRQMSANREILNFTENLTTQSSSLANYMNTDSDWDSILSVARKYEEIKAAGNSLNTLVRLSKMENPYTYVYDSSSESD